MARYQPARGSGAFSAGVRAGNVYNPCLGKPTRLAPLSDTAAARIPTFYAGRTRATASFEPIFRALLPLPRARQVFTPDIAGAAMAEMPTRRLLRVAALFNQELALLGQSCQTMIESRGLSLAVYAETAGLAEAQRARHRFPTATSLRSLRVSCARQARCGENSSAVPGNWPCAKQPTCIVTTARRR